MRKRCLLPILALVLSVLFIAGNLEAATYYINGSKGKDSNPGSLALPWKTIAKANSTLQAGDTVYLRAGTYTNERIEPRKSGTSDNYITYQNYKGEAVTISGGSRQANLFNKNWIKIDAINFYNSASSWIYLSGSKYNIIQNCTFHISKAYGGFNLAENSTYNKILNNTFLDSPASGNAQGTNPADFMRIKRGSSYNLIEGNTFNRTGHVALYIEAPHNVIRGNIVQNKYHTGLSLAKDGPILVEGNFFYDQGEDYLNDPIPAKARRHNPGIQCTTRYHIIRKNMFDNNGAGLYILSDDEDSRFAEYCRVYNNTMTKSVRLIYSSPGDPLENTHYNIFKNNIITNAFNYGSEKGYNIYFKQVSSQRDTTNKWYNNNVHRGTEENYFQNQVYTTLDSMMLDWSGEWLGGNMDQDPRFKDPDNRDFNLQPTSPLIDAGGWLTTITSNTANSQTSFTVDDARYFYCGWGMPGETGDQIETEHGQVAIILSINYGTNTITVSAAIDIVNGEGLALNYSGLAPDIGAHEYGSTLSAPTRLEPISVGD